MSYVSKVTIGSNTHLVGSSLYGTCSTAAGTAQKDVTFDNFDSLQTGVTVHVKFTNSNTVANPKLKVGSTAATPIMRYGTTAPSTSVATSWYAGAVISFTYDGTNWVMNDYIQDNNTWRGIQNVLTSDSTTDSLSAAQGKALKGLIDGKAASGHIHDITLAKTGTATINLAANSTYTLTAGGKSVVFKTPPDNNTWTALVGATSSAAGTAGYVSAPPKDGYNTKFLRADGTWSVPAYIANSAYGNIATNGTISSTGVAIANGDMLLFSDSSNNGKIERISITFDGSTATKALTQKGTWETFNNYSHPSGDGNLHVPATGTSNSGKVLKAGSTAGSISWAALSKSDFGLGNVTNDAQIAKAVGTTKGDIIYWSAASTPVRLAIGSDGQVLKIANGVPSWGSDNNTTYTAGTGLSLSSGKFNHSNSVTAGTAGTSSATSGSTLAVPYVTYDAQGHVTASGTHTHTISGFLPSSGGTLSGDLLFSDSGTNIRQIRGVVGANDYWRVAGGATASNSGWMEIATSDDGNEPIYARQYSGVYATIVRTATILDASGNTSFPNKTTSTSFNVNNKVTLQWNATDESLDFVFA